MTERRRSKRLKCRFSCEIVTAHQQISGMVADISEGGLAVRIDLEVQQGDSVEVHMDVPGKGVLILEALAWHVRHARRRDTGDRVFLVGLMIQRAPDAYRVLVPTQQSVPMKATSVSTEAGSGDDFNAAELTPYRIRLRHRSSPRTRVLSIDADSQCEARNIATAELGSDWEILETQGSATI